jgi:hypothetical protein
MSSGSNESLPSTYAPCERLRRSYPALHPSCLVTPSWNALCATPSPVMHK